MRNKSLYIIVALAALTLSVTGCFQPSQGIMHSDADEAPSPITYDMIDEAASGATPGGYWIVFKSLPTEANMLYVKAKYKVDSGMEVIKTMSVYSDTLWLEGFGSRVDDFGKYAYDVTLTAVSRGNSESAPLVYTVYPGEPNVDVVGRSVTIKVGFSSIIVSCLNPQMKNVDICVLLDKDGDVASRVTKVTTVTSEEDAKTFSIALPEEYYHVQSYVVDSYGNVSETVDHDWMMPYSDYEIQKSFDDPSDPRNWRLLEDSKLYGAYWNRTALQPIAGYETIWTKDSMRNAMSEFGNGKVRYFWDGVAETSAETSSHFSTGNTRYNGEYGYWAYPYSYFIDLGRNVELSRIKINQAYSVQYGKFSTKVFSLWGRAQLDTDTYDFDNPDANTDRLDGWFLIGRYEILKPLTDADKTAEFKAGHVFQAIAGDEPTFSKPVRYIRFKGEQDFEPNPADDQKYETTGSPYQAQLSEITLYGKDSE